MAQKLTFSSTATTIRGDKKMTRLESLNNLKERADGGDYKARRWNPRWSRYSVWIRLNYLHQCEGSSQPTNTLTFYSFDSPIDPENEMSGDRITRFCYGFDRLYEIVEGIEAQGALLEARFYDNLVGSGFNKEPIYGVRSRKNTSKKKGWQKREYIPEESIGEACGMNGVSSKEHQEATKHRGQHRLVSLQPDDSKNTEQKPKAASKPTYEQKEGAKTPVLPSTELESIPNLSNKPKVKEFSSKLIKNKKINNDEYFSLWKEAQSVHLEAVRGGDPDFDFDYYLACRVLECYQEALNAELYETG